MPKHLVRTTYCRNTRDIDRYGPPLCQKGRLLLASCSANLRQLLRPKSMHKSPYKTVIFLCALLITISLDIESNPGPTLIPEVVGNTSTVFPCGSCEQPVTWTCKGVECDFCFTWYHADCQNISDSIYDKLGNDSQIGARKCFACDNMNITTSTNASLNS